MSSSLSVLIFPDLVRDERNFFLNFYRYFSTATHMDIVEVSDSKFDSVDGGNVLPVSNAYVIVSSNWQSVLPWVYKRVPHGSEIWIHILTFPDASCRNILSWLRKTERRFQKKIRYLVHSPFAFQMMSKMLGISEDQIIEMPLGIPELESSSRIEASENNELSITVGSWMPFEEFSHFPMFLTVAHYVSFRDSQIQFKLSGVGSLYSHLFQQIIQLEIPRTTITECADSNVLRDFDVACFTGSRCMHLIPLLCVAASRVPLISTPVEGVLELVEDGKSGFIVDWNDTKSMGELVQRLALDKEFRKHMGLKFYESVYQKFSNEKVMIKYAELFGLAVKDCFLKSA